MSKMNSLPSLSILNAQAPDPKAAALLAQSQKQIGMIPNMYGFMANAPELLETYQFGYERFRKDSGFTPVEQEVVFLSVSFENQCTYCMAAHSTIADNMSKVPKDVTDAIRNGTPIADARLRALSELTREMVRSRARPPAQALKAFRDAGYTDKQVLYIVLALSVKTISNYSNHLGGTPVDAPFAGRAWAPKD